jgi:cellulose synthase/poly-beta-1,6-N-acetylglucosamine synthase-like glycosyltransferase
MALSWFWVCLVLVAYIYVGYPLLLWLASRRSAARPADQPVADAADLPAVAVIVAAYNEAAVIGQRVRNVLEQDYPPDRLRLVIVSDCSSDETAAIVADLASDRVLLVEAPERMGKNRALELARPLVHEPILVFSDANTQFAPDAVRRLVDRLADPTIGCVTGELLYRSPGGGTSSGEGLYWRYETWLKRLESQASSVVGATGAIYALRAALQPVLLPAESSDFGMGLAAVQAGYRAVYEPAALAYEELPANLGADARRKHRIALRAMRSVAHRRALLNPARFGLYAVSLLSHKLLRWGALLPLAGLLVSNVFLPWRSPYGAFLLLQGLGYGLALLGALQAALGVRRSPLKALAYFLTAHAATFAAIVSFLAGRQAAVWGVRGAKDPCATTPGPSEPPSPA